MKKSIYSDTNEMFVEWLKQAREDKNLSLRNVGEIIGRHHSTIGNVETKVRRMDVAELVVYFEEIGLDPRDANEYIQKKRKLTNLGNKT